MLQDDIMPRYAELVYNGFWFSPERLALQVKSCRLGIAGYLTECWDCERTCQTTLRWLGSRPSASRCR